MPKISSLSMLSQAIIEYSKVDLVESYLNLILQKIIRPFELDLNKICNDL